MLLYCALNRSTHMWYVAAFESTQNAKPAIGARRKPD